MTSPPARGVWMATVVSSVVFAATGCSASSAPQPASTPIGIDELSALVTQGSESVDSFRAELTVRVGLESDQAVVARAEAAVEVEPPAIRFVVIQPDEIGSPGESIVEETVVVGEAGWRRQPDGDWEDVDESIVSLLFSGYDGEGAPDISSALSAFVRAGTAPWTSRNDADGATRYTSADPDTGTTRVIVTDSENRVIEISEVKPPAGVDVEEPRRGRISLVFSDFDRVTVEVPDDLPS